MPASLADPPAQRRSPAPATGANQSPADAESPALGAPPRWSRLAQTDFFPGLTRFCRRYCTTRAALLLYAGLAALLCGLFLNAHCLAGCVAVACIWTIGIVWPWLTLRGLQGELSFERRRVRCGDEVVATITLRNRGWLPAWGVRIVGLARSAAEGGAEPALPTVPARGTLRWTFAWRPACRGELPVGDVHLATDFPFGVRRSERLLRTLDKVLVWPPAAPLRSRPAKVRSSAQEGAFLTDRPGQLGELLGVRPYRQGDSLRRVHWALTARLDQLYSCELQTLSAPWIEIVLALEEDEPGLGDPASPAECAVACAASLARWYLQHDVGVVLILGRRTVRAARSAELPALLDALARYRPGALHEAVACLGLGSAGVHGEIVGVVLTTGRAHRNRLPYHVHDDGELHRFVFDWPAVAGHDHREPGDRGDFTCLHAPEEALGRLAQRLGGPAHARR